MLIFFISSSFGRQLSENVDELGRNLMCELKLPSLLVTENARCCLLSWSRDELVLERNTVGVAE